mgnify:CR=1 FL=1|jgi:LRR receptor-like serine/threonine-protein kinase FLS2|tara:strand:- start:51 stop:536 length:486 start_codon:yes stop_codon:yes gene_type:complete
MADLQQFQIHGNEIGGTIPDIISALNNLEGIQLSRNLIQGMPTIHNQLKNNFYLKFNDLQLIIYSAVHRSFFLIVGKIPKSIGFLHRLVGIHFESNELEGALPSELGNLKLLKQMRLYHNNLTGKIPDEVCLLISEEELTYLGADCDDDGKVTCDCCTKCF